MNTTDTGSNRTRHAQRDNTPYDPANPDVDGMTNDDFPNIAFFFSFDADEPLYTVTFDINNEHGMPVPDAVVTLDGVANESGDYVFEDIAAGDYDYTIVADGYQEVDGTVAVDDDVTVQVTLSALHDISFYVANADEMPLEGAQVEVVKNHDVVATLYTNASGETEEVQLAAGSYAYNASLVDHEALEGVPFEVSQDAVIPVVLEAEQVSLALSFADGFTWFSVNVDPGSMLAGDLFGGLEPAVDDRILGQTASSLYTGEQWLPNIEIDPKQRYVMDLAEAQTLELSGQAVPVEPIDLLSGFTWLGHTPQGCLTVEDALESIEGDLVGGERIIAQTGFAEYSQEFGWGGSLDYLCPGEGYIISLAEATTLLYPEDAEFVEPSGGQDKESPAGILTRSNLQHTMTMVAQMQLGDGNVSTNPDDVVYAFVDEEVRGMAWPADEENGFIFMSIGSNVDADETVHFRVWLDDLQELVEVSETITYESLQAVGSMQSPFTLTLGDPLSDDAIGASGTTIGDAYPNPFTHATHVPYTVTEAADVSLHVYNAAGQLIHHAEVSHDRAGSHEITFDRGNHAPGLYFYRLDVQYAGSALQETGRVVIAE